MSERLPMRGTDVARNLPPGCENEMATSLAVAAEVRAIDAADLVPPLGRSAGNGPRPHWVEALPSAMAAVDRSGQDVTQGPARSAAAGPDLSVDLASSLKALLGQRRSDLMPGPADRDLIVTALHQLGSIRAVDLDSAGRVWQSRAHPSAGGTHSIEPLVYADNITSLPSGWYRQEGDQLGRIGQVVVAQAPKLTSALVAALRNQARPAAVIYAIAEPRRLCDRYPAGSSLLWRDAGAFLMTAHLLATAHGSSSTIVGLTTSLGDVPGDRVSSGAALVAHAVGAVAIGGALGQSCNPSDKDAGEGQDSPDPGHEQARRGRPT